MRSAGISVAAKMIAMRSKLSPSELNVVESLLSEYPMAGLETISTLARMSKVSEPTVTRLVAKLGFDGYADFKASLRAEVAERLATPVDVHSHHEDKFGGFSDHLNRIVTELSRTYDSIDPSDLDRATDMLTDPLRRPYLVGGRFSSLLARNMGRSLQLYRRDVTVVGEEPSDRLAHSLDLDANVVCVAFDFRRYQRDTVEFGSRVKRKGGVLIVFTDPYLSPLSAEADVVLCASIAGSAQMNSMLPALALSESLLSMVAQRFGEDGQIRLEEYGGMTDTFAPTTI